MPAITRPLLLVLVIAGAFSMPDSASAATTGKSVHCATGSALRGQLTETGTSCATARRVSAGYFSQSPPGQHVGSVVVDGFYCEGTFGRRAFHISCSRGQAQTWFVGLA
jgi:hypothetical protein